MRHPSPIRSDKFPRFCSLLGPCFVFAGLVVCGVFEECRGVDNSALSTTETNDRPNIVLILVDDMGYGDAGCYNPRSKVRTPNIDTLAAKGLKFTDAHAAGPLCHMSRYGLLSGIYPFRTDVSRWPKEPLLTEEQATLARLLQKSGYKTAMVGKWHLGFDEQGYDKRLSGGPVDRGFDSFFGIRASTDIPPYFYIRDDFAVKPPTLEIEASQSPTWSPIQGKFWRAGLIAKDMQLENVLPTFTEKAIEVIESHAAITDSSESHQPLFLYVAFPSPHTPWLPSEKFAGKSDAGMYGDFLEMTDSMIGEILAALDRNGMRQNTMVVFSSDNGPTWYQTDVERFDHDSSGGLRGMKADAWEAGHRVPLIVRWPGRVPENSVTNQLFCFTDFLATFAGLLDVNIDALFPQTPPLDSINMLSTLIQPLGQHLSRRKTFVMRSGSGLMVSRSENWKLIDGLGSGGFTKPSKRKPEPGEPPAQLYDLTTDPAEQHNLYNQRPEIVEKLTRLLENELDNPSH